MRMTLSTLIICFLLPEMLLGMDRDEALQYAIDHSEAVKIAMASAGKLNAEAGKTTAFYKPQFTFTAGYSRMGDNAEEIPITYLQTPDSNLFGEIDMTQVIYTGGRILASMRLSENLEQQSNLVAATGKRDILYYVKNSFDTVLFKQAALDIQKNRMLQRREELLDAQDLRAVGMVTSLDVRQAEMNLNFSLENVKSGESDLEKAIVDFNTILGKSPSETPFIPSGRLDDLPGKDTIFGKLADSSERMKSIDIKTAELGSRSASIQFDMAKSRSCPEIIFSASVKSSGERTGDMDESWYAAIQLQWSIFDGGLISHEMAAAKAERTRSAETLKRTRKSVSADWEKTRLEDKFLIDRIKLQETAVNLARKNYEDARGHYRAGTITLTRLGDFSLAFAEARFNLLRLQFLQRMNLNHAEFLVYDDTAP